MGLKQRIGNSVTKFLYPYIQNYTNVRGGDMPKSKMEYEDYLLQEKYLWFLGNEDLIADFYHGSTTTYTSINTRKSYYYYNINSSIRVVHSGVPSLISYSKARLLTSGGVEQKAYNKKGKTEEKENEKETELLNEILKENKSNDLIVKSAMTESWGRKFGWKISFDNNISEYPIIEKYSPLRYKAHYMRGRLRGMTFFEDYIGTHNNKYQLHEEYGYGFIRYKLFKITITGLKEVPLTTLPETESLKDNETIPVDLLLCGEKESIKSDYQGIVSEFDAIDEAWSQFLDEIRMGREETYIPEILMQGKTFDKFRKHYTETGTDNKENSENKISHNQPAIRSDEYIKAINALFTNILAVTGLSPITVGINDGIGANSDDEALQKRETASIRTRNEMIKAWEPYLEDFYMTLLRAYGWWNNKAIKSEYIVVSHGKYINDSKESKIENAVKMIDADLIDNKQGLDEIYGDELSEEKKAKILQNIGTLAPAGE